MSFLLPHIVTRSLTSADREREGGFTGLDQIPAYPGVRNLGAPGTMGRRTGRGRGPVAWVKALRQAFPFFVTVVSSLQEFPSRLTQLRPAPADARLA